MTERARIHQKPAPGLAPAAFAGGQEASLAGVLSDKAKCDRRAQGRTNISMFVASPGTSLHHRVLKAAPRLGAEHEALAGCLRVCALR